MILLEVTARVEGAATQFRVAGNTIPEAFAKIPTRAANVGIALVNSGEAVQYTVVMADRWDTTDYEVSD